MFLNTCLHETYILTCEVYKTTMYRFANKTANSLLLNGPVLISDATEIRIRQGDELVVLLLELTLTFGSSVTVLQRQKRSLERSPG